LTQRVQNLAYTLLQGGARDRIAGNASNSPMITGASILATRKTGTMVLILLNFRGSPRYLGRPCCDNTHYFSLETCGPSPQPHTSTLVLYPTLFKKLLTFSVSRKYISWYGYLLNRDSDHNGPCAILVDMESGLYLMIVVVQAIHTRNSLRVGGSSAKRERMAWSSRGARRIRRKCGICSMLHVRMFPF